MPLEPSKAGMPIMDTKAFPIEPATPVQWDTEERTAKKGVERTALRKELELPVEWTEVLLFLTIFNLLRVAPGWACGAALHLSCEVSSPGMTPNPKLHCLFMTVVFIFRFQFLSLRQDRGPPRVGPWLIGSFLLSTGGCHLL